MANEIVDSTVESLQTELSTIGLGQATIDAQQALADKYGIVTFDVEGNISTIPLTREIDTNINVGFGRYTSKSFKANVEAISSNLLGDSAGGNFFQNAIITPIQEAIDILFNKVTFEELDEKSKQKVLAIDPLIAAARAKYDELLTRRTSGRQRNEAYSAWLRLVNQRQAIFNQFAANTSVKDEIINLTNQMNVLLNIEPLTARLKADIKKIIVEGSALIEKILLSEIEVTGNYIRTLQQAMVALTFRANEAVTVESVNLNIGLAQIGEGLFGVGTVIAEAFEKIFVPDVSALKDQLIKFGIAQRLAAQELAKT